MIIVKIKAEVNFCGECPNYNHNAIYAGEKLCFDGVPLENAEIKDGEIIIPDECPHRFN